MPCSEPRGLAQCATPRGAPGSSIRAPHGVWVHLCRQLAAVAAYPLPRGVGSRGSPKAPLGFERICLRLSGVDTTSVLGACERHMGMVLHLRGVLLREQAGGGGLDGARTRRRQVFESLVELTRLDVVPTAISQVLNSA